MGLQKPKAGPASGQPSVPPKASQLGSGTDTLWEFMTADKYADGSKRERASLVLFYGDQGLTCCLSDKDNQRSLFASCEGLAELLALLDELASDPNSVWRHQRALTGHSGRKKS